MTRSGRLLGFLVAAGLVAWSVHLALASPPETDEGRQARIEALIKAFSPVVQGVPEVSASELRAALERGEEIVLVDVREPEERAVSVLPGAIDAATFEAEPSRFAGKRVIAYCTIGYRSGVWAKARRAEGLDVQNLRGSLLSWTHVGGSLVDPAGQPTKRVHVYGARWDLARTDHHPVW